MPGPSDAQRYARIRYRLLLIELALGSAFLAAFQWSGLSQVIARWRSARSHSPAGVILGYLAVFGASYYLVMLPLHGYGSFHLEHRFGLSRLTLRGWIVREVKQLAVSAMLGTVLVEGL